MWTARRPAPACQPVWLYISRATPASRAALRRVVQTQPQTLGSGFSVWSAGRLGAHLKKETGNNFGEDRLRAILREEGFSFQRPKHTMKGTLDDHADAVGIDVVDVQSVFHRVGLV